MDAGTLEAVKVLSSALAPLFTALAALVGSIAAVAGLVVSLRNGRKADVIAKQTNGMSQRLAKMAGDEGEGRGQLKERDRADAAAIVQQDRADAIAGRPHS